MTPTLSSAAPTLCSPSRWSRSSSGYSTSATTSAPATRAPRWALSYPTNIRGIRGGYTQAITRVGGIIGAYAFPVLLSAVGQRATIGYIALAPLVGLLFVLLIKWDPIGQDVEVATQDAEAAGAGSRVVAPES